MKNCFYLLTLLCIVFASCGDGHDNEEPNLPDFPKTPFWMHPHRDFMGLKGSVSKLVEITRPLPSEQSDVSEGATMSLDMRFNADGMLTYYNSTGMNPEPDQQTRGVWTTPSFYAYEYDEQGRMVRAVVTPMGDEPVVYNLTYGHHTNYVPLLFPLGPMDFFLVKGLQSIESDDGTVSYFFNGTEAMYETRSWSGNTKTVYHYESDSPYPIDKTVTTARGEEVEATEVTSYTYGEDGSLQKTDVRAEEGGVESQRTIVRYAEGKFLLPVSEIADLGTTLQLDWRYTYDTDGRLQRVDYVENKGSEDEVNDYEEYKYTSSDSYGNWTDSRQRQSNTVNILHMDGQVDVHRDISY